MCGIIAINKKDNIIKSLLKRYEKQKSRGQEGFGYVAIKDNQVIDYQRKQSEGEIKKCLNDLQAKNPDLILFHHRYPTSTINLPETAHPIKVKTGENDLYVIHNGIINNAKELKAKHESQKIAYNTEVIERTEYKTNGQSYYTANKKTFNDSEALAHDLALYLEGKQTELKSKGSIAFIAIEADSKGQVIRLLYGRNESNPLCLTQDSNILALTSEGGKEIKPDILYSIANGQTTATPLEIGQTDYLTQQIGFTNWRSWGQDDEVADDNEMTLNQLEAELQELEEMKWEAELGGDYDEVDLIEADIKEIKRKITKIAYAY